MIRIAIFGTYLQSKNVARLIEQHDQFILTGTYTNIIENDQKENKSLTVHTFSNPDNLIEISDVLIFTDQIYLNYESIKKALKNSRHVFMFPDAKLSFYQLEDLNKLAEEAGVILYVKHNPVQPQLKRILQGHYKYPEFINIYRNLNRQNVKAGRSVFDSLYDEIIFTIAVNRHDYRKFITTTVPYCSPDPSFINVRIDFINGTTANIYLNNFTLKDKRKTEIYAGDKMIAMETEKSYISVHQKNPNQSNSYSINMSLDKENDPREEISYFLELVQKNDKQTDPFNSGIRPHLTATEILNEIIPYPTRKTGSSR